MADLKSEKNVWLNKLRQVNPHWKPSEYASPEDQKAHQEDLDKAGAEGCKRHWPKEYKIDPVQEVLAQQIEELAKHDKQEEMNPSKYTENDLEQAKELIVNKITKYLGDTIFEMVCEEMSKNYLFQSQNYLTEAGYDMFEDEWFEFYHEHHGDILHQVVQDITN
jgi:predicted lipase